MDEVEKSTFNICFMISVQTQTINRILLDGNNFEYLKAMTTWMHKKLHRALMLHRCFPAWDDTEQPLFDCYLHSCVQ